MKAIAYTRSPETRRSDLPYEEKFHSLRVAIEEARAKSCDIIVSNPWVLGDTYGELIESLSRLAEANVALRVVRRS